jgi:hypothetical protein
LKITKTFIIRPRTTINNKKIKRLKLTNLKKREQMCTFSGKERKEREKKSKKRPSAKNQP